MQTAVVHGSSSWQGCRQLCPPAAACLAAQLLPCRTRSPASTQGCRPTLLPAAQRHASRFCVHSTRPTHPPSCWHGALHAVQPRSAGPCCVLSVQELSRAADALVYGFPGEAEYYMCARQWDEVIYPALCAISPTNRYGSLAQQLLVVSSRAMLLRHDCRLLPKPVLDSHLDGRVLSPGRAASPQPPPPPPLRALCRYHHHHPGCCTARALCTATAVRERFPRSP